MALWAGIYPEIRKLWQCSLDFSELFILIKEEDCDQPSQCVFVDPASGFAWTTQSVCFCGPSQWVCMNNPVSGFAWTIQPVGSCGQPSQLFCFPSGSHSSMHISSLGSFLLCCTASVSCLPAILTHWAVPKSGFDSSNLLPSWEKSFDDVDVTEMQSYSESYTLTRSIAPECLQTGWPWLGRTSDPLSIGKVGWVYMCQCYGNASHFPGSRAKKTVTDNALCGVFWTKSNWSFSTEAILLKLCCAAKLPMHIQNHKKKEKLILLSTSQPSARHCLKHMAFISL